MSRIGLAWRAHVGRRQPLALGVLALLLLWVGIASATPPGGTVTNYTYSGISVPTGIAAGPDGALWFTNLYNTRIGRVTTAGVFSNFTGASIDYSWGIAAGPDGALWFTNADNNSIGRITTAGVVSNFTGLGIDYPYQIAA